MNKVHVITQPNYPHVHCFDEIAEAFEAALPDGHKPLIFGAHLLNGTNTEMLRGGIIYQTEQITPECWWNRKSHIETLEHHEVWDYSAVNIDALNDMGIFHAHLKPIRYMPCMTKFESVPDEEKDIDVLFYGSTNPRRNKILNWLKKAGIRVEKPFGVYGHIRDHVIARSKIVLNLHQFDNGIFEIFRCAHLFANSKCVISEYGRDKDLDAAHLKSAVFTKAEHIIETVQYYLKNDERRHDQERLAFESFKSPTLEESLK